MKKAIAFVLSALILCSSAACSPQTGEGSASQATAGAQTVQPTTEAPTEALTLDSKAETSIKEAIEDFDFEGVIYAEKDGKPLYSYANGTQENGEKITIDTSLPVGSVSKQFCAAAVMLLQEQGKLSVNDTLDKYYPDYSEGSKIKLHNLLSMRSGLADPTGTSAVDISDDKTYEENINAMINWTFSKPLAFEPDENYSYANVNYTILSDIVSQVSGKSYPQFMRESFFEPLGMDRTGTLAEMDTSPEWAQGAVFYNIDRNLGIVTQGAGDIVSNAADMTTWLNALSSGRAVSADSFKTMTTDYSSGGNYGYGLYLNIYGGVGHYGNISVYSAFDYINKDKDFTLFVDSNTIDQFTAIVPFSEEMLDILMK
ncbi:MAG: serine hydrolase [Ruminococcus sp.]|nr:serine hydrolase [Ruminococcus sp.]